MIKLLHTGDVLFPTKPGDCGHDLYAVGVERTNGELSYTTEIVGTLNNGHLVKKRMQMITLAPGQDVLLRTGVRVHTKVSRLRKLMLSLLFGAEVHYLVKLEDRSSMTKRHLKVSGGIIDPSYTGEILVSLTNIGNTSCVIEEGERICQFIVVPTVQPTKVAVDILDVITVRGDKGFGSSGKF